MEVFYEGVVAGNSANVSTDGSVGVFIAAPGSEFQVFELGDASRSNPLPVKVGGRTATSIRTSDRSVMPDVRVISDNYAHIFKSGTFEWERLSNDGMKKAVDEARSATQQIAAEVPDLVVAEVEAVAATGVFKGEPGKDGANVATTRAAVAGELQDPTSPSRAVLSATIGEQAVRVSDAPIDPRRYGAKGDYNASTGAGTDDTDALRRAFADLPATGGTILLSGGRFLTHRIYVTGKSNIKVIFDNAELVAATTAPDTGAGDAGVLLVFNNCTDLTLVNPALNGNRSRIPSLASGSTNRGVQVALKLSNCTRVSILAPRIVESVHDAIAGTNNKQVTIADPTLENIGEHGVYFSTGSEDISIIGGTLKNIGASGDWGNAYQFRKDCRRIAISGGVANKVYGGIALTEGIVDFSITGFQGTDMGAHLLINSAGAVNPVNKNIKVTGCGFRARAGALTVFVSTVENYNIVGSDYSGGFNNVGGFDLLSDSTIDGFNPGTGQAAVVLKGKARVSASKIKNITGRGVEAQAPGASVFNTEFDTITEHAVRVVPGAGEFRHGGLRFTAITLAPFFDSTTTSGGLATVGAVTGGAPASATQTLRFIHPVTGAVYLIAATPG